MRRFIVLVASLLIAATSAQARSIHAIIVGDTNDVDIGIGIQANVDKMKDFFALVRRGAGPAAALNLVEITGDKFSCDNINAAITTLNVVQGDTVFFYYAGHGFRRSMTQSKFPEFYCYPSSSRSGAQLSQVARDIKNKGARLTIAIADSCNKDDTQPSPPTPEPGVRLPPNVGQAIRHLFLEHHGEITMSGSIPGQYSWYRRTAGPNAGGFFTKQLLGAMYASIIGATPAKPARWADIVPAAIRKITIPDTSPPIVQEPQAENGATDVTP